MSDVPATFRLLLAEADAAHAAPLARELEDMGHIVVHVANGRDAILAFDTEAFDAALVDRMLPGLDGIALLRRLRETGRTLPVIMLSAPGRTAKTIEGLASGADDYVVKPAPADEIDARLHALIRGRSWRGREADTVRAGQVVVSPVRFLAWHAGVAVRLGRIEFGLLLELVRAGGGTLTRATLLERVWGPGLDPGSNVVDAQIRNLRARLAAAGGTDPIDTVRGVGYRLRV